MIHPSAAGVTLNFAHDAVNRVDTVIRGLSLLIDHDYSARYLSRRRIITDHSCPVHMDHSPRYAEHRRTERISNTVNSLGLWSGHTLSQYDYSRDKVGAATAITADDSWNHGGWRMQKDVDFVYHDLYGLTDADYPTDAESEAFAYDLLGNRTSHKKRDTSVASYDHNPANEYLEIGTSLPPSENVNHDDGGGTRPELRRRR